MTDLEVHELKERISQYDHADASLCRYEKLLRMLVAIADNGEHDIGQIVIDVIRFDVGYISKSATPKSSGICSATIDERSAFASKFIQFAIDEVNRLRDIAQAKKDTA